LTSSGIRTTRPISSFSSSDPCKLRFKTGFKYLHAVALYGAGSCVNESGFKIDVNVAYRQHLNHCDVHYNESHGRQSGRQLEDEGERGKPIFPLPLQVVMKNRSFGFTYENPPRRQCCQYRTNLRHLPTAPSNYQTSTVALTSIQTADLGSEGPTRTGRA
jgi:hypothetical protein